MGGAPRRALAGRVRRRSLTFRTPYDKARYLDACARVEQFQGPVAAIAARFLRIPDPLERAAAIHAWVRDSIRYVRDPDLREELADCATILGRSPPQDDCDGKARLFVALCRACRLDARIRPVFPEPDSFEHVQAEVRPVLRPPRLVPAGRSPASAASTHYAAFILNHPDLRTLSDEALSARLRVPLSEVRGGLAALLELARSDWFLEGDARAVAGMSPFDVLVLGGAPTPARGSARLELAPPDPGWLLAELCLEGVPLGRGLEAARRSPSGAPITR